MLRHRVQRRFLIYSLLVLNLALLVGFKALKDPGSVEAPLKPITLSHSSDGVVDPRGRKAPFLGTTHPTYQRSLISPRGPKSTYDFLIQGGLHGDEISTVRAVRWLARRYYSGKSALNQLDPWGVRIDFLASANPQGLARAERGNGRGVNLNRNFSVLWGLTTENPGTHPFSERETQQIRRLAEQRQYVAAVDLHGYVPWIVGPSSPQVLRAQGKSWLMEKTHPALEKVKTHGLWMKALQKEANSLEAYTLQSAGELGDGGAFEDWAFWEMGIYAFCLELREPLSQDRELSVDPRHFDQDIFSPEDEKALKTYEVSIARLFMYSIYLTKKYPQRTRLDSARKMF